MFSPCRTAVAVSLIAVLACVVVHEGLYAGPLDGPVVISEFMASNDTTRTDEDGHTSDWIEVQSLVDGVINLDGWHLTNDRADLQKWPFPAVTIAKNDALVVYASRKDRRDSGGELHTNFLLRAGGSYLALVAPDGNPSTEFSPEYPKQATDVSYGFLQVTEFTPLVSGGAPGRFLVPTGTLSSSWNLPGFADAGWTAGTTGFGFDQKSTPTYNDFISTDTSEMRGANASVFIRIPFNVPAASQSSLGLRMRFEDGFVAYVNGQRIAAVNEPEELTWNASASASTLTQDALDGEEFFAENVALLGGENILAIHGLNRTPTSSDAFFYPELDRLDGVQHSDELRYFEEPTPGAPNGAGLTGLIPEPEITPPGGVFAFNLDVSVASVAPGATIRYTSDGQEPTENSTVLPASFLVTSTTRLRARAFREDSVPSATVSYSYVKVASSVTGFDSHLPLVFIDTFGTGIGTSWLDAHVHVVDVDGAGNANVLDVSDYSGLGAVRRRGSSTVNFEKFSMAVELRDPFGDDRDVSLIDMPAESDWVLWGPTIFDRAMMRNPWIYEISNQLGYQASRTRFVEVFVNSNGGDLTGSPPGGDYFGVYVLIEKIKRGPDRVDVTELDVWDSTEPDISGGYILKIDRPDPDDLGFNLSNGQQILYVDPKEVEILPVQADWIRSYLNSFLAALNGPNFTDPTIGYASYIDVDRFIDFHILQEFTKNPDAHVFSTFLQKDRGRKLEYGPLWDFDRSMGNDSDSRAEDPVGDSLGKNRGWWGRLFQDSELTQKYRDRWHKLRQHQLSVENMHALIDDMEEQIGNAAARNFTRWLALVGMNPSEWATEVQQLRDWQETRAEWIDSLYPVPPSLSEPSQVIDPPFAINFDVPVGDVYYTLDGSDPRLPGGGISPGAIQAGFAGDSTTLLSTDLQSQVRLLVPGPEHAALGTTWTERLFNDSGWPLGTSGIGVGFEATSGYESLIDFDVEAPMFNNRTSVYIRIAFDVANPAQFASLLLRMQYDDGFVAYLNGQRIAANREPSTLTWESSATSDHPDTEAVEFRNFEATAHVGELIAGTNVLAIHGLNRTADSTDLLFVPELVASAAPTVNGVVLNDFSRVTARALNQGTWTAATRATFVLEDAMGLRITELMYHPIPPDENSPFNDEDYEFVEVQNVSGETIDLRGVRFADGIEFDFTDSAVTSLGPQEYVVVVKNLAAFEATYIDAGILVAGTYDGQLANQGEHVRLENGIGDVIQEFTYADFWYAETDGEGLTLNLVDVLDDPASWSTRDGWQTGPVLGTPGGNFGVSQLPGDANLDAVLDIGDAISTLLLMFRGAVRELPCEGANVNDGANVTLLDFDGNGGVDNTDVLGLLSFIFLDGEAHVLGTRCVRISGCNSGCEAP